MDVHTRAALRCVFLSLSVRRSRRRTRASSVVYSKTCGGVCTKGQQLNGRTRTRRAALCVSLFPFVALCISQRRTRVSSAVHRKTRGEVCRKGLQLNGRTHTRRAGCVFLSFRLRSVYLSEKNSRDQCSSQEEAWWRTRRRSGVCVCQENKQAQHPKPTERRGARATRASRCVRLRARDTRKSR